MARKPVSLISLAYTTIVLPVAAAFWRQRDERARDAEREWRRIIYRREAGVDAAAFRAVRARLLGSWRAALRMSPLVLVLVGAALFFGVRGAISGWRATGAFSLLHAWSLVFPLLIVWSCWFFDARMILPKFEPDDVAAAWLAEGRCPSCTYPLPAESGDETDTRCPECGALWWRLDEAVGRRLTPSHPPPPPAPCTSVPPPPDQLP